MIRKLYLIRHPFSFLKLFILISTILCLLIVLQLNPKRYNSGSINFLPKQNISSFLKSATYQGNQKVCDDNTKVLVGIVSSPSNILARTAIRNSWTLNFPSTWKLIFFVGLSANKDIEKNLEKEFLSKNDIIQSEFHDSYHNLTIKVLLLLQWVNENCKQAKIFMKVDDDMYVNVPNVIRLVRCCLYELDNTYATNISQSCNEWQCNQIVGHFIDSITGETKSYMAVGYLYKGMKPDRNPLSKWYLNTSIYAYETFPDTLSGTSYLFTTNLIPYVLNASLKIPIINLEDVYITGMIMSNYLKLKLSHLDGWSNYRPQWDDACLYQTLLTVHGLSSDEMGNATQAVNELTSTSCGVFRQSLSYINKFISYYIPRIKI